MSAKGKLLITAFVVLVVLCAFGLFRLFSLRFEKGDVFPPYSSLRSDPLGCKALFMGLERIPGVEVRRNYRDPEKLKGEEEGTIYFPGTTESLLKHDNGQEQKKLEDLARRGNRLVIAFGTGGDDLSAVGGCDDEPECGAPPDGEKKTKDDTASPVKGKEDGWGVEMDAFDNSVAPVDGRPLATVAGGISGPPRSVTVNSRRCFKVEGKGWLPVYSCEGHAVMVERAVGRGSIVLMAESYLLSNEALRNDRHSDFLAWLQGPGRTAIFDEFHLGVSDNPGIMALIRKHRLVPFLLALLATALLYVWKNAVPFAGAAAGSDLNQERFDRDNFSGLVNLLKRNISKEELVAACYRQWKRTFSLRIRQSPHLADALRSKIDGEIREGSKGEPVAAYRKISKLLSEFHFRWR